MITKNLGELIDELSITNIKIYHLVDKVKENRHTTADSAKLQTLNDYRSQLINAINEYFHERQIIKV